MTVPVNPFYVAIYINYVLKTSNNNGILVAAFYGISWGHHINGAISPTEYVRMAYNGAVRLCEKKPKDPILPEII